MIKDKISILMAVYNCETTIHQAIESIISQTYPNWKLIICDDCSTDDTLKVIKEYEKQYPEKILVIQNNANSKLAASLNHCLQYADGEYCARMDGDDYSDPSRFEKQVAFLRMHPDIDLVGTEMQVFDGDKLGRIIHYSKSPDRFALRKGPCFAHATIMMRTIAYQTLGGYTVSKRTVRSQDYDLWFRFFAAGYKGANICEPLYFVREDKNAFLRRKARLYLWAVVTRWKGFRMLHYPLYYYGYAILPLIALLGNEFRKLKARLVR